MYVEVSPRPHPLRAGIPEDTSLVLALQDLLAARIQQEPTEVIGVGEVVAIQNPVMAGVVVLQDGERVANHDRQPDDPEDASVERIPILDTNAKPQRDQVAGGAFKYRLPPVVLPAFEV